MDVLTTCRELYVSSLCFSGSRKLHKHTQGLVPSMGVIANVMRCLASLGRWTAYTLLDWFFELVGLLPGFWNDGMIRPGSDENLPRTRQPRTRKLHPDYVAGLQDSQTHGYPADVEHISLGMAIRDLKTSSPSTVILQKLKTTHTHTVLTHGNGSSTAAHGDRSAEPEDLDCVFMPFAKDAQYTAKRVWGIDQNVSVLKWPVICNALNKPIHDFKELKKAMLSYNDPGIDFDGLRDILHELDNNIDFFDIVLPKMTELALRLPQLCSQPIPLLRRGTAHSITMSQEQAACLLANAFFLTFPGGFGYQSQSAIPGINFSRLYQGGIPKKTREKLKCLLHYFKTVTENMPQGNITYSRQVVTQDQLPKWQKCQHVFPQLLVSSGGTIEDDGCGMLQADFANKYIGGGVLGRGCVQEEIRFVICPELLVSLLFTEVLCDNEAVVITGPQRYSDYKGYASSFEWGGGHNDQTPRDNWGRRCTQVVAIDAVNVKSDVDSQFGAPQMCRELNKAYVGFYDPYNQAFKTAVATGNWGCGAFGGDSRLKALIQLMAAAVAGREVCYFTYKDNKLTQDIFDIHKLITDRRLTVGDLWGHISNYSQNIYGRGHKKNVFEFIQERVMSSHPTTTYRPAPSSDPASTPHPTPSAPQDQHKVRTILLHETETMNCDDEDVWIQRMTTDKEKRTGDGMEKGTSDGVEKGTVDGVEKGSGDDVEKGTSDDVEKGTSDDVEKGTGDDVEKETGDGVEKGTGDDVEKGTGDGVEKETGDDVEKGTDAVEKLGDQ